MWKKVRPRIEVTIQLKMRGDSLKETKLAQESLLFVRSSRQTLVSVYKLICHSSRDGSDYRPQAIVGDCLKLMRSMVIEIVTKTLAMYRLKAPTLPTLIAICGLLLGESALADDPLAPSAAGPARFLGVSSCASSNCHGSAHPRSSTPVLQHEFFVWFKRDKHAKAYRSLLTNEAKRMAFHLGVTAPEKELLCLNCHTTNAPQELRGERFSLADGVGCESCHGAAEHWIQSHVERDTTHQRNVEKGMRDLVPPRSRTTLCISCHSSTEENGLTHRLYGAGHPRVEFEIDTYQSVMPRHWNEDEDYQRRKSPPSRLKTWLIGQVVLAQQVLARLGQGEQNHDFSLYQCYSCHHNFSEKEYLWRNYGGKPGQPPLGNASLAILATILNRSPEQVARDLSAGMPFEQTEPSGPQVREMLRALLQSLTRPEHFSMQYVEQATMAIATLANHLRTHPTLHIPSLEEDLTVWYKTVDAAKPANPERIRELALRALAKIPRE